METDFGFPMRSYYCSVEWLTTYSNQVEYVQLLHSDDRDATSSVQAFEYFPSQPYGFQSLSYPAWGGALKIDFPLSMFLLAKTILTSLFSNSTLLVGETKTVVVVEAIQGEIKIIP